MLIDYDCAFSCSRLQMLTNNDQELKRLGMAGMSGANKKFDSFFVSIQASIK